MSDTIRAISRPRCLLCDTEGSVLYSGLRDRLFAAPGEWSFKRCPASGCGLLWLDPMPAADDIGRAYADYYTHSEGANGRDSALGRLFAAAKRGYLANRFDYAAGTDLRERLLGLLPWLYPGRTAELDFSVMWLDASRRGRLLDIGSGSGWLIEHMGSLGWQAEGIDFDLRAVERARGCGLTVHHGDLLSRRLAGGSFDAITLSHSIEHVHDPLAWLAEVHRLLRPGGRMVIATPNSASLGHRRYGEHWLALDPPRHLQLFNRETLSRALRRAGFFRLQVFTSPRDANGVFMASRAIRASGRYAMLGATPRLLRAAARLAQLVEAALMIVRRDWGEDLVAIADKAAEDPADNQAPRRGRYTA